MLKQLLLIPFLLFWYIQRLIPRNPRLWVFGDRWGRKCSDNTAIFFDYIVERHSKRINAVWLTRSKDVFNELRRRNRRVYYTWSIKGVLISLRAGLIVYSVSKRDVNPYFVNGAILINTWHGAPMKKIGLMIDNPCMSKGMKFCKTLSCFLYPYYNEYSFHYIVNTSPFFNDILMSSFDKKENNLLLTGYPRNDVFYSPGENPFIKEIDETFNYPCKIIYLPTWRRLSENDPFGINNFDADSWKDFLESTNSVLLFKGHPGIGAARGLVSNSIERIIRIEEDPMLQINDILGGVDILITDYSGAYFDYLLKNKGKIILFPYDQQSYSTKDSGFAIDYDEDIPGTRCYSWEEILNVLNSRSEEDIQDEVSAKFNYHRDGCSSGRLYSDLSKIMNIPE